MYSLDQELAFATQKVREQRAVIATLQSELAAAKQSRDREIMAYDRLNNTFLDLKLDLAAAKERESDLHRLLRAQSGLIEEQRQEIARAREALIKQWELVFTRSYSQNPIGRAEARYAREIAHTGEEVGNE